MIPDHYQNEIQAIDVIESHGLNFSEGNVIKYVLRWRKKGGVEDLRKAKFYLERLIRKAEKTEPETKKNTIRDIGKSLGVLESVIRRTKELICEHSPDRPFRGFYQASMIRMECDELAFLCKKALEEDRSEQ